MGGGLLKHMEEIQGNDKVYTCASCETMTKIRRHTTSHKKHGKLNTCNICEKSFKSKGSIKNHKMIKHGSLLRRKLRNMEQKEGLHVPYAISK